MRLRSNVRNLFDLFDTFSIIGDGKLLFINGVNLA